MIAACGSGVIRLSKRKHVTLEADLWPLEERRKLKILTLWKRIRGNLTAEFLEELKPEDRLKERNLQSYWERLHGLFSEFGLERKDLNVLTTEQLKNFLRWSMLSTAEEREVTSPRASNEGRRVGIKRTPCGWKAFFTVTTQY